MGSNAPRKVFSNNNLPHLLRKTTLFGVYARNPDGKAVLPVINPGSEINQHYIPDILNDLRLTDHYPVVQQTALGVAATLNLMKKCEYFPTFKSYNNAFDKIETEVDYKKRLELLAFLVSQIITEREVVIFSFQEAPSPQEYPEFYQRIVNLTGMSLVPDSVDDGLVTLFSPDKFTCKKSLRNPKSRIQEIQLIDKNQQQVAICNLHPKLTQASYTASYIANKTHDSMPVIVLGDSNIPVNQKARDGIKGASVAQQNAYKKAVDTLAKKKGAYSCVQGTIDESKGGVDTYDVIVLSRGLEDKSSVLDDVPGERFIQTLVMQNRKKNDATLSGALKEHFKRYTEATVNVLPQIIKAAQQTQHQDSQSSAIPVSPKILVINGHGAKCEEKIHVSGHNAIIIPGNASDNYTLAFDVPKRHLEEVTKDGKIWPVEILEEKEINGEKVVASCGERVQWTQYSSGKINNINISPLQHKFSFSKFASDLITKGDQHPWAKLTNPPHKLLERGALAVKKQKGDVQILEGDLLQEALKNSKQKQRFLRLYGQPIFYCDKAIGKIKPLTSTSLSEINACVAMIDEFKVCGTSTIVATCSPEKKTNILQLGVMTEGAAIPLNEALKLPGAQIEAPDLPAITSVKTTSFASNKADKFFSNKNKFVTQKNAQQPKKVSQIAYIDGTCSVKTLCSSLTAGISPKQAVFVFPSNTDHHNKDGSPIGGLHGIKRGGGLARVAQDWGVDGNPTLGLPTSGMKIVGSAQDVGEIAHGAVKELYKALGAGFHLMFPVRNHSPHKGYFGGELDGAKGKEPSFWGGIDTTPNKGLSAFYLEELNKLDKFAKLLEVINSKSFTSKEKQLHQLETFKVENPILWRAYQAGIKKPFQIKNSYPEIIHNTDCKTSRFHLFKARYNLGRFKALSGDTLKNAILEEIKGRLEENDGNVDNALESIDNIQEKYMVLKNGQGLATKLFGFETSSITALRDMIEQCGEHRALDDIFKAIGSSTHNASSTGH